MELAGVLALQAREGEAAGVVNADVMAGRPEQNHVAVFVVDAIGQALHGRNNGRLGSRHGFQVNAHLIWRISRRKSVFHPADFSACFDASFGFVGAHEAEREAAHDGHVLGAVAGAIARQVVLELDIEQPMHALDAPMAARAGREAFDVERRGRNVEARVERASVGVFRSIENPNERLDALETRSDLDKTCRP